MKEFLGEFETTPPYSEWSRHYLVLKCEELEAKWLSEQREGMTLSCEYEEQARELQQVKAENARLRAALSVICNASQAARFDDLRQVAYEALTALKGETKC